jgi:hypothetical protein
VQTLAPDSLASIPSRGVCVSTHGLDTNALKAEEEGSGARERREEREEKEEEEECAATPESQKSRPRSSLACCGGGGGGVEGGWGGTCEKEGDGALSPPSVRDPHRAAPTEPEFAPTEPQFATTEGSLRKGPLSDADTRMRTPEKEKAPFVFYYSLPSAPGDSQEEGGGGVAAVLRADDGVGVYIYMRLCTLLYACICVLILLYMWFQGPMTR